MKIYLKNRTNTEGIKSVRSQIKDKGNLKKFDEFIAKHEVFDVSNDDHMKAAQGSCIPDFDTSCNLDDFPSLKLN